MAHRIRGIEQKTMTTGAVIFAYNNEKIDYVGLAAWSAKNIRRHLDIPVCLITDTQPSIDEFDQVICTGEKDGSNTRHFGDLGHVIWYNLDRMNVYNLTPWDQTLVLDADYVVASDQLRTVLACQENFVCHKNAYDITGKDSFDGLNVFGKYRMPMWWATVMMFRKSVQAQMIFNAMTMVRNNWTHYRRLYCNNQPTYRNDHALSIALNLENGHTLRTQDIPWRLASLTPDHQLKQLSQDHYRVEYFDTENRPKWIDLSGQDFHAMGKQQLGEIVASNS
jgi:hypothetical protein